MTYCSKNASICIKSADTFLFLPVAWKKYAQSSARHRFVMAARTYSRTATAMSIKLTKTPSTTLMARASVGGSNRVGIRPLDGESSSGKSWINDGDGDEYMMMDK